MCSACEEAGRVCKVDQPCQMCLDSSKLCHYNYPDKLRQVWEQSVERYGREQALERLANTVKEEGGAKSSQKPIYPRLPFEIHSSLLKTHQIDALGHFIGETSGVMTVAGNANLSANEVVSPQVNLVHPMVSTYNQAHLLDSFFTNVHPRYPLISEKDLKEQLQAQSNGQPSSISIFFLYAIYAAGAKMMPSNVDFSVRVFFDYCMEIKHLFMDRPRISSVCALILLAACVPDKTTNGQSSKMLSAMLASEANTMARIMGLHRHLSPELESPTMRRDRRRVFWVLFVTDRLYCMVNGFSPSWDEKHIDVTPPSPEDYEDDPNMAAVIREFTHYIKLCKIVGRICNHGYAPKSEEMRTSWKQDTMLSTLDSWLTSYILELPPHLRYDPSTLVATPRMELDFTLTLQHPPKSLFARLMHLIIHTCLILLHSPYISDSEKSDSRTHPVASQPSLDLCIYASTLITHITSVMQQEYPIMTSECPYTSHALLIAIRIHLMCALSSDAKLRSSGQSNFIQSANILFRIGQEADKPWIIDTLRALHRIYASSQYSAEASGGISRPVPKDAKRKILEASPQRLSRKKSVKLSHGSSCDFVTNNSAHSSPNKQLRDPTISPSGMANVHISTATIRSPSSASSTSSSPSHLIGSLDGTLTTSSAESIKSDPSLHENPMFEPPFGFPMANAAENVAVSTELLNFNNLEHFSSFGNYPSMLYTNPMFSYPTATQAVTTFNPGWNPPHAPFDPNYGF
ncbi:hypothetical protein NQZ79_g3299 [Umbelopsis isabellina]|nr:hypothetical protein NQZ79_g3299 [Umbelopsis isabellina]